MKAFYAFAYYPPTATAHLIQCPNAATARAESERFRSSARFFGYTTRPVTDAVIRQHLRLLGAQSVTTE